MEEKPVTVDQAESLRRQSHGEPTGHDPRQVRRARKIAVTSGKGGVGKSNVSLNLAIAFGKLGQKVLLIDADTNLANIDILLGVQPKHTLSDVVFGSAFFSDVIVRGPEGVQFLPGSSGVVELLDQDVAAREKLFEAFEDFDRNFDVILIDTGAGLTNNVVDFVIGADDVVLVTNSEPTSITDAYAMVKVLTHRNPALKIHVLVNLSVDPRASKETFEKLQLAVRNFLNVELLFLGNLPLDPNVPAAVAHREPFLTLFPRSAATTSMIMMARKLLKITPAETDSGSILSRIFRNREQ